MSTDNSNIIRLDFNGFFYDFSDDGWFNATIAAARYGKRPVDWLALSSTQEYISVLARIFNCEESSLLKIKSGRYNSGTWLHPKLAVAFTRWLDIEFSIWCDIKIDSLIRQYNQYQDILNALLRQEPTEWEKRFGPGYYIPVCKLWGWGYLNNHRVLINGVQKSLPDVIGQVTSNWVYEVIMPPPILEEMYRRSEGRKEKLHQWATDGGLKLVLKQVDAVAVVAGSSLDYRDFSVRAAAVFPRPNQQLGIIFPAMARIQ